MKDLREFIDISVRKYLNEETILKEDTSQAESLLKKYNIPLNDPDYLEAKNRLIKTNSVGYLGAIVKLSLITSEDLKKLLDITDFIIEKKSIIKRLSTQIQNYNDIHELWEDVFSLENKTLVKKLANKLTNTNIKNQLLDDNFEVDEFFIYDVSDFLKLNSAEQKEFLRRSDKYKDFNEFSSSLHHFMKNAREGFTFNIVKNKISGMSKDEINLLYIDEKRQLILARILKFSASAKIGSEAWCIVGDSGQFNNYTNNGLNFQYFLFNFNTDISDKEKMVAFTLKPNGVLVTAFDRFNNYYHDIFGYFDRIGIKRKILEINSRQGMEYELTKLGKDDDGFFDYSQDALTLRTFTNIYGEKEDELNYDDVLGKLSLWFFKKILSPEVNNKNHLDIIIKKFENYPVFNYDFSTSKTTTTEVDILHSILYLLTPAQVEKIIPALKVIYLSNIISSKHNQVVILNLLKNNGVDILTLSKQKKAKNNEYLTDMEFAMLKNRGENLKPIIQNKIAAIRRGENVTLNLSEIYYAIENGFKGILEKYYKKIIPRFYENQLSYDDMNIYRNLGLLDNVANIVIKKAQDFGISTLNSIEKSIFDIYKNR